MKTLQVLEPEKLTPEEVKALRSIGFDVKPPCVGVLGFENITTWPVVGVVGETKRVSSPTAYRKFPASTYGTSCP